MRSWGLVLATCLILVAGCGADDPSLDGDAAEGPVTLPWVQGDSPDLKRIEVTVTTHKQTSPDIECGKIFDSTEIARVAEAGEAQRDRDCDYSFPGEESDLPDRIEFFAEDVRPGAKAEFFKVHGNSAYTSPGIDGGCEAAILANANLSRGGSDDDGDWIGVFVSVEEGQRDFCDLARKLAEYAFDKLPDA